MVIGDSSFIVDQWLRNYTCSGFCKTSYKLLISPPPTNLANTLKIHTGENKIDRQGRQYTIQYTCYFPANAMVRQIRMFFSPKPSPSQGKSSLKISACWGLLFWRSQGRNNHTNSLTDSTDRRALLYSDVCIECKQGCSQGGVAVPPARFHM